MATFNRFSNTFTRDIQREIDRAFDDSYINEVGSDIVNQIQVRTRAGFGVARNGDRQRRLRPLSRDYVETRSFARRVGLLANTTTPSRSNLTFTGNMLESIRHRLTRNGLMFYFSDPEATRVAEEVQSPR